MQARYGQRLEEIWLVWRGRSRTARKEEAVVLETILQVWAGEEFENHFEQEFWAAPLAHCPACWAPTGYLYAPRALFVEGFLWLDCDLLLVAPRAHSRSAHRQCVGSGSEGLLEQRQARSDRLRLPEIVQQMLARQKYLFYLIAWARSPESRVLPHPDVVELNRNSQTDLMSRCRESEG